MSRKFVTNFFFDVRCVDPPNVSAHSAEAYTATLYVMVNVVKGVGVHTPPPPTLTSLG
jgi:hypothetical protein